MWHSQLRLSSFNYFPSAGVDGSVVGLNENKANLSLPEAGAGLSLAICLA